MSCWTGGLLCDLVLLELSVQRHPRPVELPARLALVPVRRPERRQQAPLLVAGCGGPPPGRPRQLLFDRPPGGLAARAVDEDRLEQVPELANVARPVVGLETGERLPRDSVDSLPELPVQAEDEVVDQLGHVLAVLAQRRNRDPE